MGIMFLAVSGIIAAGVAAGLIIYTALRLAFSAVIGFIKGIFQKIRNKVSTPKVALIEMDEMVKQCKNRKSLDDLLKEQEKGVTHYAVPLDENDNFVDGEKIEAIKGEGYDAQLDELLGDERMVIVEG